MADASRHGGCMTLTGNLGVFMAADMVSFYLFFTLVSLAAYGLVVHDGTPAARRAGAVYVGLCRARRGLSADGLRAAGRRPLPDGSLLIRDAVAALPASPWRDRHWRFSFWALG